jgi:hypothetical protein
MIPIHGDTMQTDNSLTRRTGLLPVALFLAALSGCASFSSRFPSHDEVFIPVPLTVGELRVEGTDTAYVLTGPGYELRSKDRSLLTDAQSAIDRTEASFARYFVTEPPMIRVVLKSVSRKGPRPDSAAMAADNWPRTVTVFVWKPEGRDREMMGSGVRDEAVSLPVARAWLAIITDSAARGSARTRLISNTGPDTTAGASAPGWIQSAMTTLIAGSPDPDFLITALAKHPERMVPLRTLFAASRQEFGRSRDERGRGVPNGQTDQMGDPGRGMRPSMGRAPQASANLTGPMLLNAEATSVAAYLGAREGRPFVGHLALALSGGARFGDLLGEAKVVQHDFDAFERDWKAWVADQGNR